MKDMSKEATVKEAYGKKLDTPLKYQFKWRAYETPDECKAANDMLSDKEQMKVRNTQAKLEARSKAQAALFEANGIVKPTAATDPQIALKDMVKLLLMQKTADGTPLYTEEQARIVASTALKIEWADEDDDE